MIDEILVNVGLLDTRIALLDEGRLAEAIFAPAGEAAMVGRLYLVRVTHVANGVQAAFVDIGLDRSGFLPARDARYADGVGSVGDRPRIAEAVHEGQAVLVQVTKEPIGDKGPRLSTDITLPGRHLVLAPWRRGVSISRRIGDEAERDRLAAAVSGLDGDGGLILRTAAVGVDADDLRDEAARLMETWAGISARGGTAAPPACVEAGIDPVCAALRDHMSPDVRRVVVDDGATLGRLRDYCAAALPWSVARLEHHRGPAPLFDSYDVEGDIDAALQPRVSLPSGGAIVVEATEALTAVDVNSGRYTAGVDAEETALRTNLEAAEEIAWQLRLRDIGGIVVVDFMRMSGEGNVVKVLDTFGQALARDRAPVRVAGMSELGLVEMTRRRVREPLAHLLTEPAPVMAAGGRQPTVAAVTAALLRRAEAEAAAMPGRPLLISAAPEIIARLGDDDDRLTQALANRLGCAVTLHADPAHGRDDYRIGPA